MLRSGVSNGNVLYPVDALGPHLTDCVTLHARARIDEPRTCAVPILPTHTPLATDRDRSHRPRPGAERMRPTLPLAARPSAPPALSQVVRGRHFYALAATHHGAPAPRQARAGGARTRTTITTTTVAGTGIAVAAAITLQPVL